MAGRHACDLAQLAAAAAPAGRPAVPPRAALRKSANSPCFTVEDRRSDGGDGASGVGQEGRRGEGSVGGKGERGGSDACSNVSVGRAGTRDANVEAGASKTSDFCRSQEGTKGRVEGSVGKLGWRLHRFSKELPTTSVCLSVAASGKSRRSSSASKTDTFSFTIAFDRREIIAKDGGGGSGSSTRRGRTKERRGGGGRRWQQRQWLEFGCCCRVDRLS
mmetsp:Transcript_4359/g.14150  ORF Transcript_4359/g.14150 Transcript_4359/m.14150 type:complete len:218 (-) Transcript_4359:251-904(-)